MSIPNDIIEAPRDRTGFHTPQRATQLVRLFRTNAPVGTRVRLGPTDLGSCRENVSALLRRWWLGEKDPQVVSNR